MKEAYYDSMKNTANIEARSGERKFSCAMLAKVPGFTDRYVLAGIYKEWPPHVRVKVGNPPPGMRPSRFLKKEYPSPKNSSSRVFGVGVTVIDTSAKTDELITKGLLTSDTDFKLAHSSYLAGYRQVVEIEFL